MARVRLSHRSNQGVPLIGERIVDQPVKSAGVIGDWTDEAEEAVEEK